MPKTQTLPIDEEKLRSEIRKRGLTPSEVSTTLGRATTFISHAFQTGYIAKATTIQLEHMFNLKYEAYKPAEPLMNKPLEVPERVVGGQMTFNLQHEISKKELWEIIYTANKKAYEDAFAEFKKKEIETNGIEN